jgi:hypothetical protein
MFKNSGFENKGLAKLGLSDSENGQSRAKGVFYKQPHVSRANIKRIIAMQMNASTFFGRRS